MQKRNIKFVRIFFEFDCFTEQNLKGMVDKIRLIENIVSDINVCCQGEKEYDKDIKCCFYWNDEEYIDRIKKDNCKHIQIFDLLCLLKDLSNKNAFDYVAILKVKVDRFDLSQLAMFFNIFAGRKENDISLLIDLTDIDEERLMEKMRYNLGYYLQEWKDKKSVSGLPLVLSSYRKSGKNIISAFPSKANVLLKKFTPLIQINVQNYEKIFEKKVEDFFMDDGDDDLEKIKSIIYRQYSHPKNKIDYDVISLKVFADFLRLRDAKLWVSDDFLTKVLDCVKHESIFTVYVFVIIFNRLMIERSNSLRPSNKWINIAKSITEEQIKGMFFFIGNVVLGVKEICENIIYHTAQKTGYVYFEINGLLDSKIESEDSGGLKVYLEKMKGDHELKQCMDNMFIKIFIIDKGEDGIVESFLRNNFEKIDDDFIKTIGLEQFYIKGCDSFIRLNRLDVRYLAHLGLKTFSAIIGEKKGYFKVSTNNDGEKSVLVYSDYIIDAMTKRQWARYKEKKYINGTKYEIIVPITKEVSERSKIYAFEKKSTFNSLRKWLLIKNDDFGILNYDDFADFKISKKYADRCDYILREGIKIIEKIKYTDKNSLAINAKVVEEKINDLSVFVKILAYVQLNKRMKYLFVYNVSAKLIRYVKIYLSSMSKSTERIWRNDVFLILYDENYIPFIISGSKIEHIDSINKGVALYYGSSYSLKSSEKGVVQKEKERIRKINVVPYELIIRYIDKNKIKKTLFEASVEKVLESPITGKKYGVKHQDVHIQIGSKIHLNNFYEANFLFQNSYYVERFAFLVTRDILKTCKKRIVLLGYGDHSEMIMNRIMTLLSSENNSCYGYFIKRNDDECIWRKFGDEIDKIDFTSVFFAVVVPVGTSLTTNYKIFDAFKKYLKKENYNYEIDENQIIFNVSIILIRDQNKNYITENESIYGWKDINEKERKVITEFFDKPIKYYISVRGEWNVPYFCGKCFPDLSFGEDSGTEFVKLYKTNKISINPDYIIGRPNKVCDDRLIADCKEEIERLYTIKNSIKYGHFKAYNNHHLYYIDTKKVYDENISMIIGWLKEIKESLNIDENASHIIVKVQEHTDSQFVNLANDIVFDGSATLLKVDLNEESLQNTIIKNKYLLEREKIQFHYFDDVLLSGRTINQAKAYISSMFYDKRSDNIDIFSNVVVLINRLSSLDKKNVLSKIFAYDISDNRFFNRSTFYGFVNLNVPSISFLRKKCAICDLLYIHKGLISLSVMGNIRLYYQEKINKYSIDQEVKEKSISKRHFERLLLTHHLYNELSDEEESIDLVIQNFFAEMSSVDVYYQINRLKVLANAGFLSYVSIADSIVSKISNIFIDLIKKDEKTILLLDYNFLLTLINILSNSESFLVMRKQIIYKVWMFYMYYRKKYDFYDDLFATAMDRNIMMSMINIVFLKNKKRILLSEWSNQDDKLQFCNKNVEQIEEELISEEANVKKMLRSRIENVKRDFTALQYNGFVIYDESLRDEVYVAFKNNAESVRLINYEKTLEMLSDYVESSGLDDKELICKSLYNVFQFKYIYVAAIKRLVYDDESASFWLQYLFGTGEEINIKDGLNVNLKSVPFNDLYEHRKKIEVDDVRKDYVSFLLTLNIENNFVFKKALDIFDLEYFQNDIREKIENIDEIKVGQINILVKKILNVINNNIYYKYLTLFSKENFLIPIIKLYVLRVFIRSLSEDGLLSRSDKENTISKILFILSDIFSADYAIFLVKNIRSKTKNLYNVGQYGRDIEFSFPFEISDLFYSYNCINSSSLDYVFFSPEKNEWDGEEKEFFENILILRFFYSRSLKDSKLEPVGGIVFGYNGELDDYEMAIMKEKIKITMLINDDIQYFIEKQYDNESFNSYIRANKEAIKNLNLFEQTRHGAEKNISDISDLIRIVDNDVSIIDMKRFYVLYNILASNIRFGVLYALVDSTIEIESIEGLLGRQEDSFTNVAERIRSACPFIQHYFGLKINATNNQDYEIELNDPAVQPVYKRVHQHYIDSILFEIVSNALKHNNNDKFSFSIDIKDIAAGEQLIVFRSSEVSNPKKVKKLIGSLNEEISVQSKKDFGEGLYLIKKIIQNYLKDDLSFEYNKTNKQFIINWTLYNDK